MRPSVLCYLALIIIGSVSACAKSEQSKSNAEPTGVIPQYQLQALGDAEATQQVLLQADRERREKINEMSQ